MDIHAAIRQYLLEKEYKKLSLKAILFDMDGVLYDTLPNHVYSWVITMRNYGLSITEEDVYLNEGRIGADTIDIISKREGKSFEIEERKRIYREKAKLFESFPPASIMKGCLELLQKVTEDGLIAMVVTGSGQPTLINQLNNDFNRFIKPENRVTSFDVTKGKPDPESYLFALQKGGLRACEAIVVENAPFGVEAARAAGLFVIAVNTGILPDSALMDAGANLLFPSLEALSDKWEELFNSLTA
jgi:HAD superfamily hydrolase (TIGR01509 family)